MPPSKLVSPVTHSSCVRPISAQAHVDVLIQHHTLNFYVGHASSYSYLCHVGHTQVGVSGDTSVVGLELGSQDFDERTLQTHASLVCVCVCVCCYGGVKTASWLRVKRVHCYEQAEGNSDRQVKACWGQSLYPQRVKTHKSTSCHFRCKHI